MYQLRSRDPSELKRQELSQKVNDLLLFVYFKLVCIIVGFSEGMGGKDDSDRSAYRKGPSDFDKKAGAGSDFQPEFVSDILTEY